MEQEEKKENLVAILLVEEGNKPGQPIATYSPQRRVHHLVFMPREAPVGQQVRIKLVETGKEDSRGHMLYRGIPDVIQYEELWHDNGDGTVSLVLYSQNWLLQRIKEGERESRPLAVDVPRPEEEVAKTNYSIDWGKDFTSTTIVETKVLVTPLYREYVGNGEDKKIEWTKTGEQEVPGDMNVYPLTKIGGVEQPSAQSVLSQPVWDFAWLVNFGVYFIKDGQENNIPCQTEFSKLQVFCQQKLQAEWPLCLCGRERIALASGYKSDDYPKCNQCRSEEHCERCGEQKSINYLAGHLICNECKPYESAEQLINQSVSAEHKQALADLVKKLLTAQPLEAALGILVLKNNLSHISNTRAQERILDQWKGYQWYYSVADGFYGTKFPQSALAILQYLPQASGNGLVEMVAWLTGNFKAANDFYTRTQMRGEEISLPDLQRTIIQIMSEKFGQLVADKLCSSEADRLSALEGRQKLEVLVGQHNEVGNLLREVDNLLQSDEQDYSQVLNKISEAKNLIDNSQRLENLLTSEYSVCPICGGELNRNSSHYCGQDYEVELGCLEDGELLQKSFSGKSEEVLVSLVFRPDYQGLEIQINQEALYNLGTKEIITEISYNVPTEAEKSLRVQMNELKRKLAAIEREHNTPNRVVVSFSDGLDPKGEKQLQADATYSGTINNKKSDIGYSEYDNQAVIFVCNIHSHSWLDEGPQPQQVWSCKPAFQISMKDGKPVIVVNPQLRLDQEAEIRAQIETLQKEENNLAPEATVADIEALKAAWGLQ